MAQLGVPIKSDKLYSREELCPVKIDIGWHIHVHFSELLASVAFEKTLCFLGFAAFLKGTLGTPAKFYCISHIPCFALKRECAFFITKLASKKLF